MLKYRGSRSEKKDHPRIKSTCWIIKSDTSMLYGFRIKITLVSSMGGLNSRVQCNKTRLIGFWQSSDSFYRLQRNVFNSDQDRRKKPTAWSIILMCKTVNAIITICARRLFFRNQRTSASLPPCENHIGLADSDEQPLQPSWRQSADEPQAKLPVRTFGQARNILQESKSLLHYGTFTMEPHN